MIAEAGRRHGPGIWLIGGALNEMGKKKLELTKMMVATVKYMMVLP